jgi:hypothetical protein
MSNLLISDGYLKQQQILHENPNYGFASLLFAPIVADIIRKNSCKSISDYGAGKKRLLDGLRKEGIEPNEYLPYDPAFPEYGLPKPADLVCCVDVLEHIEPEYIENVFVDLSKITKNLGFFSIHLGPAGKTLTDGRNAHLIQKPITWWLQRISQYFEVLQLQSHSLMGSGCWIIVAPK